jgi:hypothetical protein
MKEQLYCATCGPETFAVCLDATVPSEHVLSLKSKSKTLYEYSLPFAYVIVTRYLRGLELDFDKANVSGSLGFIEKHGGAKYLLVANVSSTTTDDGSTTEKTEVNRDTYSELPPYPDETFISLPGNIRLSNNSEEDDDIDQPPLTAGC